MRNDGWYWIKRRDRGDQFKDWVPALWTGEFRSWSSAAFSGIPEREVIVGDPVVGPKSPPPATLVTAPRETPYVSAEMEGAGPEVPTARQSPEGDNVVLLWRRGSTAGLAGVTTRLSPAEQRLLTSYGLAAADLRVAIRPLFLLMYKHDIPSVSLRREGANAAMVTVGEIILS